MAYLLLYISTISYWKELPMSLLKDVLHTLTRGATKEDRPLMAFMIGLAVLSVSLIILGLTR
jgi:hypothetical protein